VKFEAGSLNDRFTIVHCRSSSYKKTPLGRVLLFTSGWQQVMRCSENEINHQLRQYRGPGRLLPPQG
jgi:hypothetical protein